VTAVGWAAAGAVFIIGFVILIRVLH